MKRYEGLFILNTAAAAKEEGIKDTIDKISAEINLVGGRVETVQKMDKRTFTRIADKKFTAGFFVNIIFQTKSEVVNQLQARFNANDDIFRVMFTQAPEPKAETK